MRITVDKIDDHDVHGNGSDVITTFIVKENSKEFTISCRSNRYGRSFSLVGKDGTLYIDREDQKVHLQKVALGGGCGLLIDDEPVVGLSPLAIHGAIIGVQNKAARKITIQFSEGDEQSQPVLLIDGNTEDFSAYDQTGRNTDQ